MKPKILIVSDSPKISSGMGVAHLEIATALHNTNKYEIASFGWFWHHAQASGLEWKMPWPQFTTNDFSRPYGHPNNWGPNCSRDDMMGSALYKAIERFKPQVVIGIGDVWMLDYVRKLPNRKLFKFIWEFPIDGEPVPPSWVENVREADIPVVMSQYAIDVLHNVDPLLPVVKIPRGIDLRLFMPITPLVGKDVLRKEVLPEAVGKFVVAMFDRFQDRKQINRGVEAFAKFISRKRDDAVLYLHMDVHDIASTEQGKHLIGDNGILDRYGVRDRTILNENLRVETGVDVDKLVKLYNCADVKISSTQGEGWGLTNIEAMACGVPVIATNYTTMPEILAEGRGLLADVKAHITGMYNVERALVDTDHMAAQIDSLYCSPELRRFFVRNAWKWIPRLDWSVIMPQWEDLIEKCLYKPEYRLIGKKRDYEVIAPTTEVAVYGAIREDTGWAITTRGIAKGLEENGAIVNIKEGGGSIPGYVLDKEIEAMTQGVQSNNIHLINHMPELTADLLKESNARIKIAFFPFELPRLDPNVVESINRNADIYLGPSHFCADMATAAGVRNAKVLNIHSDIDMDAKPYDFTEIDKKYKFLCLGNLGDVRKNVKTLIKAYLKTFNGNDDVCLVLKSLPGHLNSDPREMVEQELLSYDNPASVLVMHQEINPSSLYKSCDCLVMPSLSEGFCAPIYEALHFGMPVITTGYGGQVGHIQASERMIHLPYKITDAKKSPVYKRGDTWAEVDFKALCTAMARMYESKTTLDPEKAIKTEGWAKTGRELLDYVKQARAVRKIYVYFENQERNLWNNDNNVNLKRYAPNRIVFVDNPKNADYHILNITRLSDAKNIKCKNYVALYHCKGEWSEENIQDYWPLFKNALFVYSHQNLAAEFQEHFKFLRGPWGTDDWKFYKQDGLTRTYKILNTGLVASTEAIEESFLACASIDAKQLHVGQNFGWKSKSYNQTANLDDEQMRMAYNSCEFVSGMRRIEGFEKPVIEGLLCGARPICFDTPLFRHWYGGLAEFVPECPPKELVGHLVNVFKAGARPVTETEMDLAIKRFGWRNVAINFWDYFEKAIR